MKKEHIFKDGIEFKECSSCKNLLTLNMFSNNKSSFDGLKPYCKSCASLKGKKYRETYREDVLRQKREWYLKTKEKSKQRTKEQLKEEHKICNKCKRDLEITEFRQRTNGGFYSVCRQCENIYNKKYRKERPEIYKVCHIASEQRRRKRAEQVISTFTSKDWKMCKLFFKNKCAYCGRELKNLTQDHIIPLSKGGNYTKDNIIPVCRNCNSQKHNKEWKEWYRKQKFYSKAKENKILEYVSTFK